MYKVLIVDDEPLVALGIKASLDWEKTDFVISGEAESGKEALALVPVIQPDIVLTDIKMPDMDGIALLAELQKLYPKVRVIMLSCLNEGEIVRQALKMGAVDYILKLSLKPGKILEILNSVKNEIEEAAAADRKKEYLEGVLKSNHRLVGSYLFQQLVLNELELSELRQTAEEFHVDVGFDSVVLAYLKKPAGMTENGDGVKTLLESVFDEIGRYYYFEYSVGIVVVMDGGKNPDIREIRDSLRRLMLQKCVPLSLGISNVSIGFASLRSQAFQAKEANKHAFYYQGSEVYIYQEVGELPDKPYHQSCDILPQLIKTLMSGESVNFDQYVKPLMELVLTDPHQPHQACNLFRRFCYELLHSVEYFYNTELEELNGDEYFGNWAEVDNIFELVSWAEAFISQLEEIICNGYLSHSRSEVVKARQYVKEHLDQNITLDHVAEYVSLSRSHFSTLFKQEQKESFTHYVNREKMEYAQKLLLTKRLHVYEAAKSVGIDNENYFSKLFKKIIGVSPSTLIESKEMTRE